MKDLRTPSGGVTRGAFQSNARGIDRGAGEINLFLTHDQRWQKPHDIVASLDSEHLPVAERRKERQILYFAFQV